MRKYIQICLNMIQICLNLADMQHKCVYLCIYYIYGASEYLITISLSLSFSIRLSHASGEAVLAIPGLSLSLSLSPSPIPGRTYGNLGSTREPTWCRSVF